jgi:hypothetical protein
MRLLVQGLIVKINVHFNSITKEVFIKGVYYINKPPEI